MDQIPQPKNNQSENKNIVPPVTPPAQPVSPVSPASNNISKSPINMNTEYSGQQFKLASTEVQGHKPPLVSGKGSKFALVVIAFILIVIAGIGGYYFYAKDSNLQSSNSPAAALPTATPPADKNLDTDKDGLPDAIEKVLGTNPDKADTDSDGYNDLQELKSGYSPLIAGSAGKYTPEQWANVKGKIMIEDREFYDREFGVVAANSNFICGTSTVSDIDSNTYNTVLIGSQCWLKENLKVTKNPAGEAITRYCFINDSRNCNIDGGLYDWNTTMNKSTTESAQGICPNGWHVPKNLEWLSFKKNSVKDNFNKLETIFAGFRNGDGKFSNREVDAFFWSSTQDSAIGWNGVDFYPPVFSHAREYGLSVRCLKD